MVLTFITCVSLSLWLTSVTFSKVLCLFISLVYPSYHVCQDFKFLPFITVVTCVALITFATVITFVPHIMLVRVITFSRLLRVSCLSYFHVYTFIKFLTFEIFSRFPRCNVSTGFYVFIRLVQPLGIAQMYNRLWFSINVRVDVQWYIEWIWYEWFKVIYVKVLANVYC